MPKKKASGKDDVRGLLKRIDEKLNVLSNNQKSLMNMEKRVIIDEEAELNEQKEEESELKQLEDLEKRIDDDVKVNPLTRIGIHDFFKSIIGAFIGIIGHFSFFYGVEIAHDISVTRAVVLYLVSFLIGLLFVYFAGFRKVSDLDVNKFVPVRVLVIYLTSIAVIIITLYLFGFLTHESSFEEIFKTVSTISILAVLGASTADLIGRGKE